MSFLRLKSLTSVAIICMLFSSCNLFKTNYIKVITPSEKIKKFESIFIPVILSDTFNNPFDSKEIQVDALIKQPDGSTMILPCFYKSDTLKKSVWEARFTARQAGKHVCYIRTTQGIDTNCSKKFIVVAEDSKNNGFLHMNKNSFYSFVFDSGKQFRGVGMNLGWELETEWKYPYDTYFKEFKKFDANFTRIWMCPWNLPLEWTRVPEYTLKLEQMVNWDSTLIHTDGLILVKVDTKYTEDDTNRILIDSKGTEILVYKQKDLKKFKIKLFYEDTLIQENIKFYYSKDNKKYISFIPEFSLTVNTAEEYNWNRIFIGNIKEFPSGTNFLKIEFNNLPKKTIQLASVEFQKGKPINILDAPGLGKYYQKTADRLDTIVQLAEENDIYIMLCFDYHGIFKPKLDRWGSNDEWRRNPYNIENGGPCKTSEDFFTNSEAKRIYKNRLRYLVARWSYSTNIGCWELWNEIDNVMEWQGVSEKIIADWHKEMAEYIKQIDPYKHIITTSVSHRAMSDLWNIKNIEFTQHHEYGNVKTINKTIKEYTDTFKKPDVVGEYAIGWKGPGKDFEVEEYEGEMHDGMWRGMFAPSPVLPLSWWWEFHYFMQHYYHFKPVAEFIRLMIKNKDSEIKEFFIKPENPDLELLSVQSGKERYIWLKNHGKKDISFVDLILPPENNLTFKAKYYNTWTGIFSSENKIEVNNNQLQLNNLKLGAGKDMAIWMISQ